MPASQPTVIDERTTKVARLKLMSDHVIEMDALDPNNAYTDMAEAHLMVEAVAELTKGRRCGILSLSVNKSSHDARKFFQAQESAVVGTALMVNSAMERVLASVLIGIFKLNSPTKIFTDRAEARKWLLEIMADDQVMPHIQGATSSKE